jgi:hypothetical protein
METAPEYGGEHENAATQSQRPMIGGVEVREEDLDPQRGLHITTIVFRVSAVVIFVLALFQFAAWWVDRPPGNAGIGLLIGDTIRLIVFAALLWAISSLASIWVKTHYDIRASRILLARQTHVLRLMAVADGALPPGAEGESERRGAEHHLPGSMGPHA